MKITRIIAETTIAEQAAEIERLKLQAEMACIEPRDSCECSGCLYAAAVRDVERCQEDQ